MKVTGMYSVSVRSTYEVNGKTLAYDTTNNIKIDCDVLFGSDVADTVSRKVMYSLDAFVTGGSEFVRSKDFVLAHSQILQEIEKKPIDEGFTQIFQSGHGNVTINSIIGYY